MRKSLVLTVSSALLLLLLVVGIVLAAGGDSYYSLLRIGGAQSSLETIGRSGVADSELYIGASLTVITDPAVGIGVATAVLRGYLESDRGGVSQFRFYYWSSIGPPVYKFTTWTGAIAAPQSFQDTATGLSANTLYYFRAQARDGTYTGTGGLGTFTTYATVSTPSDFLADPISASEVSLLWVKGVGAPQTEVRYREGGYPVDHNDGTLAYRGYSSSYVLTGLTSGTTYYFRAWGFDYPVYYSGSYVEDMATTTMGIVIVGPYSIPSQPGNWFTSADPSGLTSMPGYSLIVTAADSLQMPVGSLFLILGIVMVIGVGAIVFVITGSVQGILVVMLLGMFVLLVAGIIPGWMFFTYAFLGVSGGLVLRGGVT